MEATIIITATMFTETTSNGNREETSHVREVPNLQHARGLAKRALRQIPTFRHPVATILIDGVKIVTIEIVNEQFECEYEEGHSPAQPKTSQIAMKRAGWYAR